MRQAIALMFLFATMSVYCQQPGAEHYSKKDTSNRVSFVVKFDKNNATKDGYYLGGYVVVIDYRQAQKLYGKKIRITGKVSVAKGLDSQPQEYDKNGELVVKQGRAGDTKYILSPAIKVISNQ
ncbi:MAG: hypothetical protein ABUT20_44150 [Bacteroidota bacterium]